MTELDKVFIVYACYLVEFLVITQKPHETGQRTTCSLDYCLKILLCKWRELEYGKQKVFQQA